jgi:hypothetical protein
MNTRRIHLFGLAAAECRLLSIARAPPNLIPVPLGLEIPSRRRAKLNSNFFASRLLDVGRRYQTGSSERCCWFSRTSRRGL